MNKGGVKAVLFDLDGTLIDTAPELALALNAVCRDDGKAAVSDASIRTAASHGSQALIRLAYPELSPSTQEFERRRELLLDHYHAGLGCRNRLFSGCEEVLSELSALGIAWGIVTNKPAWLTQPLLARMRFPTEPDCVVSGDTVSRPKPAPDPLLHAAQLLGFEAGFCIYLGDAERDIQAANAAGMRALVALYGYLAPEDTPSQWGGAGTVETPLDLLHWL